MLTINEWGHIRAALEFAIVERRRFERNRLRYTMDSGQVRAWEELLKVIPAQPAPTRAAQSPKEKMDAHLATFGEGHGK